MGTYWIAQRTLVNALNGKENPKAKDICTRITDSFCRTAEINTTS